MTVPESLPESDVILAEEAGTTSARQHQDALREVYGIVEAAQDHDVTAPVAALDARARTAGWADVALLLHFARSLAAREAGQDDSGHVEAMLDSARALGDPALLALALATTAQRAADVRLALPEGMSGAEPLVRAVAQLDDADSLVVHRVAAHLEVAGAFHALGLWPLATEQLGPLEALFAAPHDPFWDQVLTRQRRVVHANALDMALDEACACAEVGDWDTARRTAARWLPQALPPLTPDWPPTWVAMIHAFADLFAALAGRPSPADVALVTRQARNPATDANLAMLSVADAIRAHRDGDPARAAQLAQACACTIGPNVPVHVRLLALNLAAHTPGTPPVALLYARELAGLRWNARLGRMASMRSAIDAERRRVEHEILRGQVFVDDLTGLGNRRAYGAYLERIRRARPGRRAADLVIMMIDVDHFKTVNDRFGHDVGDQVLRRIGTLLAGQVRPVDLAARLGGDEFVVVMPQDTQGVGEARSQAIVSAVCEHPWDEVAPGLRISISLGVHRGPVSELDDLPAAADRQLYVAKREGRGRVAGA
ncbi:GGDEF domain-containing protein [Kineosporia sp. J2-2]|uniref:GGDEF domain-containing protein n=1 Tax=Kineosporia corallincola TaxID=2835133 RepID=A0ABS5TN54_9ACTN|nr:GGDEF domain-containing protein [Kineosporia corallincola]MBT0772531.1 GGDEF domain-containing protein [Kineosporia corallincola]